MTTRKARRSRGTGTLFRRAPGGPWIARWTDHAGRRREVSTGTTDKAAAGQILARNLSDESLRRRGILPPDAEAKAKQAARPLADHLADYDRVLQAKGVTEKHRKQTIGYLASMISALGITTSRDLNASRVYEHIAARRERGASAKTRNMTLRAAKQFSAWMAATGRLSEDPLKHLKGWNQAADVRRVRRDLAPDEERWLMQAARTGGPVRGLSGEDRAVLYAVALNSGLRAAELRSLTPESFDLAGDPPTITVQAACSKHRRTDVQPIPRTLAMTLRPWLAARPPGRPVWPGRWPEKAAAMFRVDLRRARAAWIRETADPGERRRRRDSDFLAEVDAAGRVLDFHATRHTYISRLVQSGASVKVCQELARHATPTLTIGRYAHVRLSDLAAALAGLEPPTTEGRQKAAALREGTTGDVTGGVYRLPVSPYPPPYAARKDSGAVRAGATRRDGDTAETPSQKARKIRVKCESERAEATCCDIARPGNRTPNLLVKSQPLCQLS